MSIYVRLVAELFRAQCERQGLPPIASSFDRLSDAAQRKIILIMLFHYVLTFHSGFVWDWTIHTIAMLEEAQFSIPQSTEETRLSNQLRRGGLETFDGSRVQSLIGTILDHSTTPSVEKSVLDSALELLEASKSVTEQSEHQGRTAAFAAAAFWQDDKITESTSASHFLLNQLKANHELYAKNPALYVAPYVAVVGPSGIGKSFAIKELATTHQHYVVYVNLSSVGSQGYPGRSGLADTIGLFCNLDINTCAIAWRNLINLLRHEARMNHDVNISPRDFFYAQVASKEYMAGLASDLPAFKDLQSEMEEHVMQGFNNARRGRLLKYQSEKTQEAAGSSNATSMSQKTPLKIIICLDEARSLLSITGNNRMFRAFRRGARSVTIHDFFAVLLDTTSHVANFSPNALIDHSQRNVDSPLSSFDPIYSIDTFDAFAESQPDIVNGTEEACRSIFKLGRPLWGALLEHGFDLGELRSLAGLKLGLISDPQYHFILLSHRVSFNVTNYNLADHMVAQCMRYIVHISKDRTLLATAMGSEPLLAIEAAARMKDASSKLKCLQGLMTAYGSGLISLGDVGEVVAALILLFTMDKTQNIFPEAIELCLFIKALFGEDVADQIQSLISQDSPLESIWRDGKVYFNHFYRPYGASLDRYPSKFIEKAFQRSAALFFPCNFPGADIGIPIYDETNRKFSMLLIQVKNWKGGDKNSAFERLTAHNSFEKARAHIEGLEACFGLMMSLHADQPDKTGVVVGNNLQLRRTRQTRQESRKPSLAILAVGLDSRLYPSVCSDECPEVDQIFESLCTLRDGDPFYRLGSFDAQTLRMVNNILDWRSDETVKSRKRKASQSPTP